MNPKQIIIKSLSHDFTDLIVEELSEISSIKYNYKKFNGQYIISIKCFNYYQNYLNIPEKSFYGSYIYLYTNLSLILSTLIIYFFESKLIMRIINQNYFYFDLKMQKQISTFSESILNPELPILMNQNLYTRRRKILVSLLLNTFRKTNYLNIDAFINFSAKPYFLEIEKIVDKAVSLCLSGITHSELLKALLEDWYNR